MSRGELSPCLHRGDCRALVAAHHHLAPLRALEAVASVQDVVLWIAGLRDMEATSAARNCHRRARRSKAENFAWLQDESGTHMFFIPPCGLFRERVGALEVEHHSNAFQLGPVAFVGFMLNDREPELFIEVH